MTKKHYKYTIKGGLMADNFKEAYDRINNMIINPTKEGVHINITDDYE